MSRFFYSAFGHRLSSSIPLPELRSVPTGSVRWDFQVTDRLPAMEDEKLLGEELLYASVSARLFRHARGHRIVIDDTGSFDLLDDNCGIRWQPNEEPWWDFGRSHLIGRVLATSLQLSGTVTLHGSAVGMADGVVGFLAPKHFGKSTLAMMLFQAGARFVTDDSLAVTSQVPPLALPGIPSLRVRLGDADAERLLGEPITAAAGRDGKVVLPPFPADRVLAAPSRLAALYFVTPTRPDASDASVSRTRVPGVVAAIRLVSQTKIGGMLGSGFARELLDEVTAIVSSTPVYELAVVRDLDRLPEVVERLVGWHGVADPTRAGENG